VIEVKLKTENDILKYLLNKVNQPTTNLIDMNELEVLIDNKNLFQYYDLIINFFIKNKMLNLKINENEERKLIISDKKHFLEEIQTLMGQPKEREERQDKIVEITPEPLTTKNKKGSKINHEIPIVISFPPSLTKEVDSLKEKFKDLKIFDFGDFLVSSLRNAKEEVLICNPFIGIGGILVIFNELIEFTRRKVKLKILTRNVYNRESKDFAPNEQNKIMGIVKIFELYNSQNLLNLIEIKDFGIDFKLFTSRYKRHYEGIHQKMIIIDNQLCYIGSGEIRDGSLYSNGECGCLFTENRYIQFYKDFFNIFWDSNQSYLIKFKDLNKFLKNL